MSRWREMRRIGEGVAEALMPEVTGFGRDGQQKIYHDREAVQHHGGSAERPRCGCGSWLNHWLAYTGNLEKGALTPKCVYMGCSAAADDGAHIREVIYKRLPGGKLELKPKGAVYIVPLCKAHNRSRFKEPFFIRKDRWMVDDTARDICKSVQYILNKNNYFHMRVERSSGPPDCGCASHFDHYRKVTGSARSRCVAMECGAEAKMAASMRSLDGRTDRDAWIAPLCSTHAKAGTEMWIKRQAELGRPGRANCRG